MNTNCNDVYYIVGKIIESVQNIEYNLVEGTKISKILRVFERNKTVSPFYFQRVEQETKELTDAMTNMSFGQLMGIVRKFEVLPSDDLDYLESLLSKRNQLVHRYFKYNELNKCSEEMKIRYLNNFLNEALTFNNYLEKNIEEMKNDLQKVIYE